MPSIADNLAAVRFKIQAAAQRSGRPAGAVRLVAVSKTQPVSAVAEAFHAGQRDFGENRVQEALAKRAESPQGIAWHLIGHLQGNKAKLVPGAFACVHSIDSIRLAEALDRCAESAGQSVQVLLQANLTGEASKSGVRDASGMEALLSAILLCRALVPVGLMTIPDPSGTETQTRTAFARLRALLETLRTRCGAGPQFVELSMGMSQDFEWAIDEGATYVRVGTAIFGRRTPG